MSIAIAFLRAWVGEEEYREARLPRSRTRSYFLRFWGRLTLALAGLGFFLWQQITEPAQWWGSDGFGKLVLALTLSQAAGPLLYVFFRVTEGVFLTRRYRETVQEGAFYLTWFSVLGLATMTILSLLAASGFFGSHWYIRPLVFLLTVPVACFWLAFPAYTWTSGKVRSSSRERRPGGLIL